MLVFFPYGERKIQYVSNNQSKCDARCKLGKDTNTS